MQDLLVESKRGWGQRMTKELKDLWVQKLLAALFLLVVLVAVPCMVSVLHYGGQMFQSRMEFSGPIAEIRLHTFKYFII